MTDYKVFGEYKRINDKTFKEKHGRMFLFEKDLEDGTNCIIFKRYKKRCEK